MRNPRAKMFVSWAAFWLAAGFLLMPGIQAFPQQNISKAYQVKALFLYNFTQFVEWPEERFPEPDAPLIIGVLGDDPFGAFIDELVKGEVIQNHPLVVERYASVDQMGDCHILYLNVSESQQMRRVLSALTSRSVLTVSDAANFTRLGGMIQFLNDRGRIAIQINVDATSDADLVVSSKLLRLSEIVTGKNE